MKDQIDSLIAKWQKTLGVTDWDIRFSPEPVEGLRGNISMWPDKRAAVLRVGEHVPPSVWDEVVCHEVCHVLLNQFDVVFGMAVDRLGAKARGVLHECYTNAQEVAIQRLVNALTSHGLHNFEIPGDEERSVWAAAFPPD